MRTLTFIGGNFRRQSDLSSAFKMSGLKKACPCPVIYIVAFEDRGITIPRLSGEAAFAGGVSLGELGSHFC